MEGTSLIRKLKEYTDSDYYPYHMPGHKRKENICEMADFFRHDITEIDGFDNLHDAKGILKKAMDRANSVYGADETYFLVNGSTCGVLAAVLASTEKGDEILAARGCHKSVYHAAILQELKVHYFQPEWIEEYDINDGVSAALIEAELARYPQVKAVIVTSPTYEGILSDISAIATVVHAHGKILIVDEAHGAHLAWERGEDAVSQGADLVVHSLHKTLPAMTQTALLHRCSDRVKGERIRKYLSILQTSSPSYVLMASIDACIRYMEEFAKSGYQRFEANARNFLEKTSKCRNLQIGRLEKLEQGKYHLSGWDRGKLVISVKNTNLSGQGLYDILREEFHLQMEMAAPTYVLAMMTIMDTSEGWNRLADALLQIDGRIEKQESLQKKLCRRLPKVSCTVSEAFHLEKELIKLVDAQNKTAADFVNLYPPGIPLLVPGECISQEIIDEIQNFKMDGLIVQGVTEGEEIWVTKN